MSASDFFRNLEQLTSTLEVEITQDVISVEAEAFHEDNFQNEGFTDRSLQKWPARKPSKKETKRRALLVKTTALKKAATKGRVSGNQVDFIFPSTYMGVHNEGGRAGRGKGFDMPKRQFVGKSHELEQRIERKARLLLDRKFRKP
jgi:phage gpG-like protein